LDFPIILISAGASGSILAAHRSLAGKGV